MRKFIRTSSIFSLLYFILFVSIAFGAEYDYYVYNGYDSAVNAWHKVSLIFGGNDYLGVLFLAAVVGALILFYAFLVRAALGARVDPLRVFGVPFLGGLILGALFIIPKDSLVIYDPVSARGPQRIDGIPRIVALAAYTSNKIERLMINIIDNVTISESGKYSRNAGGVSYSVLRELYTKAQLDDCSVTSLSNYMQDCVLLQVNSLEQSGLIQKVKSGEADFFELLSNAAHPSLFVTVCNPSTKASETKTCESAYNQNIALIRNKYSVLLSSTGDFIKSACRQLGFSDSLNGLQQCHSLISSTFNDIALFAGFTSNTGNIGLESAKRQYDIARIWRLVLLSNNPALATATIATSQTMSSFWGLGVHANSWIPVIKASVTSLAIALTPIVLILLVTPLAGRALSFVFGVFIWITCWTLVDALVLSLGNDLANYYASSLKSGTQTVGFGSTVSFVFPEFLEKVIATFGMLRWAGLGLATVLSTMLVRFGGTVMAMVAGQITSAPMGSGASVGGQVAVSPSSLLTGTVLPMETYGSVAVRSGGLGALYNPLLRMEAFGLSSKAYAGDVGIKGDAFTAGRYAGSVQAVQLQSQTETGTFTFGQERRLGEGLGRLGALDMLSKGEAGLKFSPGEVRHMASDLAAGTATDIRGQATRGSLFKGREKEYGEALGLARGARELGTAQAWEEHGRTYRDLVKSGMDPIKAFEIVRSLGIPTDQMDKVFKDGVSEVNKAEAKGYNYEQLRNNINNPEFQQQLSSQGINVDALRRFFNLVDTLSQLGLSVDTAGLEKLKRISLLANVIGGMKEHAGADEFKYRATGEAWTALGKVEGFGDIPWYHRHGLQALGEITSIGDVVKAKIRGAELIYTPGKGWEIVGVSSLAYQDDKAKKSELSIEQRVQMSLSAKDERARAETYNKVHEVVESYRKLKSSKGEKDWVDFQIKLSDLVETLRKHGFSRQDIYEFLKYKLGLTADAGVGAGASFNIGGGTESGGGTGGEGGTGGGGGTGGEGGGIKGGGRVSGKFGASIGGSGQFLSPSKARRENEKAEVSGTVKDSISVDRFQFKSSQDFVSGLEAAISSSLGKKFTFSEDIRKALTESIEKATTAREVEGLSFQNSVKMGFNIPDPLVAKIFNESIAKHKNAFLAIRDVYLALSNPQEASKLLGMELLDTEKAKKELTDKMSHLNKEVEERIMNIGEQVPSQFDMKKRQGEVIGDQQRIKSEVQDGLKKKEQEAQEAENKAKQTEGEKKKQEEAIYNEYHKVPGKEVAPPYIEKQEERVNPDRKTSKADNVNEEALEWWKKLLKRVK